MESIQSYSVIQSLTLNTSNEEITISARELYRNLNIAERFSKWFDRMIEYGFEENVDFTGVPNGTPVKGGNGNVQYLDDYQITIDMAKEIAMLQRNEKGKEIRLKLIELEKAWNSPEKVMARALNIANKTIKNLTVENEAMKPKALFADAVATSHTSILVGELAKILKQNGIDMGQKRLFAWLREKGYLIKRHGTDYNMPTQKAMDLGLFEIKEGSYVNGSGVNITTKTPKVTGKGQQYFINKFLQ